MIRHQLLTRIENKPHQPPTARLGRRGCPGGRSGRTIVSLKTSLVRGVRFVPARDGADQCGAGAARGHVRRMDRPAHRHPAAPCGGGGGIHLRPRPQGRRAGHGRCRRHRRGHRPGDPRHLDAGPDLSGHRRHRAGAARNPERGRVRSAGGLLGLRVRALNRRRAPAHRVLQARPGDRGRDLLAHSRLGRPRHLRAVRRRRGRGGAGSGGRGQERGQGAPDLPPALRRPSPLQALCGWRALHHRHCPAICAWKAARFSSMRWA